MFRAILIFLFAAGWLGACSRRGARDQGRNDTVLIEQSSAPDSSGLVVDLRFTADSLERMLLMTRLALISKAPNAPDLRRRSFPAQIYRVTTIQPGRYFMLAYQPRFRGSDGDHWGKSFFVIEMDGEGAPISPPLDMKDAEYVVLEALRDVNGDSRSDLIYCKGYEGEEAPPTRLVAAYLGGRWIDLPNNSVGGKTCPVQ